MALWEVPVRWFWVRFGRGVFIKPNKDGQTVASFSKKCILRSQKPEFRSQKGEAINSFAAEMPRRRGTRKQKLEVRSENIE